jgi:hypothetical protein
MASKATSAFIEAVIRNDLAAATKALDAGADINATLPKDGRYPPPVGRYANKGTPILVFVATGNKQWLDMHNLVSFKKKSEALLQRALEAGANPNVGLKDKNWGTPRRPTYTPLYHAAVGDDLRAAELLLAAGADPNTGRIKDHWNVNPLGHAIKNKNRPMAMALLRAGADIQLLDNTYRERLQQLVHNFAELINEGKTARAAAPAGKKKTAAKKKA